MTADRLDPLSQPMRRSRFSLRVRLIGLVVLATLVALTVLDLVLPRVVRAGLIHSRDQSLIAITASLPKISVDYLRQMRASSSLKSGVGWTLINEQGVKVTVLEPAGNDPGPDIPPQLPAEPVTVGAITGSGSYRILSSPLYASNGQVVGAVVVWTNLADIDDVLTDFGLYELLITLGLLLIVGGAASLLIRRELQPLEKMAAVADSISAGDLGQRVPPYESGKEIDRLGLALNGMLDRVDVLLSELQASEARLRQFVGDASHELRTPVAAVRGYTELHAAGALPEPSAVNRAMERMGFEARRMGSLVDDLLTLVQADTPGTLTIERVDLSDLLRGAVEDARAIDGSRTWLLVGDTAGPSGGGRPGWSPGIAGDRHRLHQLFANLLGNVREHTPAGTTVRIGVTADADPRYVVATVSDDGPGVDPAALPHLFERFFRADPSRSRANGGSGLGLSIVAAIAHAHGGAVAAGPAVEGGLAVRVRLPRAPDDRPAV